MPLAQLKRTKAAETKLVIYDCTIEIWFSILSRRLLKRGNFKSVEDLQKQLLDFIEYFNAVLAKPFKWTYKGRPLQV
jgi:hypothetical protein